MHWWSIVHELLWFLRGDTNIAYLKEKKVRIWNEWADDNGDLGPVYGYQWRNWDGQIDQIANLVHSIKHNPFSRRHILSSWNVSDVERMALPPCHTLCQFYVKEEDDTRYLSCQLYQRSADLFLGVPFNIASYSLLTHMLASVTGCVPDEFVHTFGDLHIYANHMKQVQRQLARKQY